jgi:hypothetical protein
MYRLFLDSDVNGGYLSPLVFTSIDEAKSYAMELAFSGTTVSVTDSSFNLIATFEA